MKIAIVLPPGFLFDIHAPNSIETVVRTLHAGGDFGHEVKVFCDAGARDHGDMSVVTVRPGAGRNRAIIAAIRAFGPDYIEFQQNMVRLYPIAAAFPDIPNSIYRHNYIKPRRSLTGRLRRWWYGRPFGAYIFVSGAARTDFLAQSPQWADLSFAVPNPIDAALWYADPQSRDPVVVFCGRAAPEKGFEPFCHALAAVLTARPDWRGQLLMNKSVTHPAFVAAQLRLLEPFGSRVRLMTDLPLSEVRHEMKRAGIAVIPSLWEEAFGLTALEAHAAGAAVVSSGRGGLKEVSGSHAVYVGEVTWETLAAAIIALIDDAPRRIAMASEGQAYVAKTHTASQRANELNAARLYIQAKGRPRSR
ncbi:glycosyltransferase family 4 protein [Asticcacaulis sp. 201]|uniref:glycosyltransferase family 4 protein n=1 Tax=Asticcacaulis sp. 201 TaxID=3028787 RepID=UPI002915E9ED|nr:glycosyltransferase family 4 protein [Asticcacaulis sp. 201]MDV6330513.1 glycosyltransferase family 4 protein [Asticcacaulis sp. 201]